MGFFNRRMNVLGTATANALDEVRVMVTGSFALRPRLVLIRQPCLVRVVSVDSEIAVRTVEQIADGVGFGVLWSQGPWLVGWLLGWSCRQARSRHPTGPISACANLRFMIGDQMANLQFHHLEFVAGCLQKEYSVKRYVCLIDTLNCQ